MSSQVKTVPKRNKVVVVEFSDDMNFRTIIENNKLVIIYFYRPNNPSFEQYNKTFEGMIDYIKKEYPRLRNVVIGKIDCYKAGKLLSKYFGYAYPNLRIYRNGGQIKKYFNLPITESVFRELEEPIGIFNNDKELENLDRTKHLIIGYFDKEDMPEYEIFHQVAQNLKEYCQFDVRYGYFFDNETSNYKRPPNQPTIIFIPGINGSSNKRETFKGCVKNYNELNLWAHKKCLAQELTFENYAHYQKDSKQILILFYNPGNTAIIKDSQNIVGKAMMDCEYKVNVVTADGLKFSGYLRQIGFSKKDLPIIENEGCIFPHFKDIYREGIIKNFVRSHSYIRRHGVSLDKYVKSELKKKTSRC